MPAFAWAILIKPFVALLILGGICAPIRIALQRKMRDGKLKRLLLRKIGD